ncbi:MAG: peptide deformylase [Lachnospiraceae bacterium]|nr:peptide deformylase [Lachnospiraceae bacterium]
MALRKIRTQGDKVLNKPCKPVTEMTSRTEDLIDDMIETMYDADGVGLAAPQVGILKRLFVIDVTPEGNSPIVFINPEILSVEGEQTGLEGCLSVPGKSGVVTRPNKVRCRYQDRNLEWQEIEGEGLLARAILHENDHLDGHLYVELVSGKLYDNSELTGEGVPELADEQ